MLVLDVGAEEAFDEEKQEFVTLSGFRLELEHSLFAISKWESQFEKPFLGKETRTTEETVAYVKHMSLTPDVPADVLEKLQDTDYQAVNDYINAKMTATWFREVPGAAQQSREIITSELVYYWLIALNIPWETQYWHLNRLLTLIKVCNQKNQPPKKMSRRDIATQNRKLNAERRARLQTNG